MVVNILISMRANQHSIPADVVQYDAEVELEPKFLPYLRIQEIAAKLAVEAFEDYLARAEADEQEAGE